MHLLLPLFYFRLFLFQVSLLLLQRIHAYILFIDNLHVSSLLINLFLIAYLISLRAGFIIFSFIISLFDITIAEASTI